MGSMRRTVKRVIDGDTIQVNRRIGGTNVIRLANVNAPEKYQFGGKGPRTPSWGF